AGTAASTKQAGVFLLPFIPFIILEVRSLSDKKNSIKCKHILIGFILLLFFALPWNLLNQYHIHFGNNTSNIYLLTTTIHGSKTLIQRLVHSFLLYPSLYVFTLIAIPGLFFRGIRVLSTLGILYIICWSLWLSYDVRNAYFAIPFLSFSIGLTLQKITGNFKIDDIHNKSLKVLSYLKLKTYRLLIILLSVFIAFALIFSSSIKTKVYQRQDRKVLSINDHKLENAFFLKLAENESSFFITDSMFLRYTKRNINSRIIFLPLTSDNISEYIETLDRVINHNIHKKIYLCFIHELNHTIYDYYADHLKLLYSGNLWVYEFIP
ncbi:MAG: hypothetical protein LBF22_04220, partial [Deltaproteobacteria bacterium]|nr:hypothetical protein [Deltaproteobacteria bacterium]